MIAFLLSSFITFLGLLNLLGISNSLFMRQSFSFVLSVLAYFFARKFKNGIFYLVELLFFLFMFLNLYLLFFGETIKGAKRWIKVFGMTFQPSEIFLVFFIFFTAKLLTKRYAKVVDFALFLQSLAFALLSFFLIYFQPDLTTSLEFLFVYFFLLIFSPLKKKYFYYLLLTVFVFAPLIWLSLKPYQKERIIAFLKRKSEIERVNYNIKQTEITIGAGGLLGQGLGKASQVRLAFLPERHTDFAFASFVSQTGFLGGSLLLVLYGILLYSLIKDTFYAYLFKRKSTFFLLAKIGFASHILYRVGVNIGMNLGLLPIAGVPLILFSFGGSSLLAFYFGLGVISSD